MHIIIPLLLVAVVLLVIRGRRTSNSNKSRPTGALPPVEKIPLDTLTVPVAATDTATVADPDPSLLAAPVHDHDHGQDGLDQDGHDQD
ncbi:MAG: hypothetical protein WCT03_13340, partial [Candidatus Obscuribacterales bacterium]